MGEARVSVDSIQGAFGVPITVTVPSGSPVLTTGTWTQPLDETPPHGQDLTRRDPRKVLAIPRSATLDAVPRGSAIAAPEYESGPVLAWRADGLDGLTAWDLMRIIVVRT